MLVKIPLSPDSFEDVLSAYERDCVTQLADSRDRIYQFRKPILACMYVLVVSSGCQKQEAHCVR